LLALFILGFMLDGFAAAPDASSVYLVKDGASPYRIVLEPSASPSEKHAAEELRKFFKACTGVDLPVADAEASVNAPMIVLGCGPVARKLGVDPSPALLGEQGYMMRTIPPHIVIAGTSAAGTLYGVYDFLENQLGVRWYAPEATKTPAGGDFREITGIKDLPLPHLDKTARPAFLWRHTSYAWPGGDADFRARQRDNDGTGGPDHPQGTQYTFDGTCHTYFNFISPDEFFDSHPEYFSEIDGVRRKSETQLCLTNPDVLEIVTQRMLERMAKDPRSRQHNFSIMDWYNGCQCAHCRAINEQYGTPGGTQYWFINQLAERTAKVYPEKLIGTLAYTYTADAPKGMKMHPNVAVWLCHIFPSCDTHPIATCPVEADYKRRAIEWSHICSHLYIWHYIVNFMHYYCPFPNFGALAADMRFYRDIGVEGVYLQGMSVEGGGGEFSLLRPYYAMKLLWDPGQDPDVLLRDFLQGYYGTACEPLFAYIKLLQTKVDTENIHTHMYMNPAQGYLTDDVLQQAMGLFDRAEAAVKDDADLLERVRVARIPLTYARVFPRNGYAIENDTLTWKGPFAPMPEVLDAITRMNAHGFTTVREMGADPTQLAMVRAALSLPFPLPSISNPLLVVNIAPFLGGRALVIQHRASGQSVTAYNVTRNLWFPFAGGEDTRIGGAFTTWGLFTPYDVVEKTDTSITLSVKGKGYTLRRTLTLSPTKPVLTIRAEVTNTTGKPAEVQLRGHIELDLGRLSETRVSFTNRAGERIEPDMARVLAGLRDGERYLDQEAPKGAWTFTGTKGLQVNESFDDASTASTWLYAYPADLNELEAEVYARTVTIDPGKSAVQEVTLEILSAPRPATSGKSALR